MRLYYAPGACSLSPHIALREADRAFELERVDLKMHRTESGRSYYDINPKGYVPALAIDPRGNEILTEGPAILQYVADLVPERGLAPPNGTLMRYHLVEWLNFVATELHKPFGWLFAADTAPHTQARARGKIGERLQYVNGVLASRGYCMGESFTVVDGYLFVIARWCERFGIDLVLWPNINAWVERMRARPSVQAALAAEGLTEQHGLRRAG